MNLYPKNIYHYASALKTMIPDLTQDYDTKSNTKRNMTKWFLTLIRDDGRGGPSDGLWPWIHLVELLELITYDFEMLSGLDAMHTEFEC